MPPRGLGPVARTLQPRRDGVGTVVTRVSGRRDVQREVDAEQAREASEEVFRLAMDSSAIGKARRLGGHRPGGTVLATVAERRVGVVRSHDVVARIGGDAFVVAVTDVGSLEQLSQIADECRRAVQAPMPIDGRTLEFTLSVGWRARRGERGARRGAQACRRRVAPGVPAGFGRRISGVSRTRHEIFRRCAGTATPRRGMLRS